MNFFVDQIIMPGSTTLYSCVKLSVVVWITLFHFLFVFILTLVSPAVSTRFRYDWAAKKNLRAGYFLWSMVAYGSGMIQDSLFSS